MKVVMLQGATGENVYRRGRIYVIPDKEAIAWIAGGLCRAATKQDVEEVLDETGITKPDENAALKTAKKVVGKQAAKKKIIAKAIVRRAVVKTALKKKEEMIVTQVTSSFKANAGYGITDADFADYLKMDLAIDTNQITGALNGACKYVEKMGWFHLGGKIIKLVGSAFESDIMLPAYGGMDLPPNINYHDVNNSIQDLLLLPNQWYLEQTGISSSVLHIVNVTFPPVYARSDAVKMNVTIESNTQIDDVELDDVKTIIYQLAGYLYDCRVNDKDVLLTVVDKMLIGLRLKEF